MCLKIKKKKNINLMDILNDLISNGDDLVLSNLEKNIYEMNRHDKEYWNFLIMNSIIKEDLIIENINYIDLDLLLRNQILSKDLILLDEFWNLIIDNNLINVLIKYQNLHIDVLNRVLNEEIDWDILCKYQNLTIEILNDNKDKINWDVISECQFMTLEFIAENRDKINWDELGKNSKIQFLLNDAFIELFKEYNLWSSLIWSNNISNKYVLENLDKLNDKQMLDLLEIKKFNEKELNYIIERYDYIDGLFESISEGQDLSIDFIKKNLNKLDIDNICLYQNIDFDFIYNFKNIISLKKISYNENLNEEIILKIYNKLNDFGDEFDWDYLSEYVDLSDNTVKKIKELNKIKLIKKKMNSED